MKRVCFCVFVLAVSTPIIVSPQSTGQNEAQWKTYRNPNYNFSFRYPVKEWTTYEGFDRNGVDLTPRGKNKFHLPPEIGAGGAVGQPSDADERRKQTLDEDFQFRLDVLKEYGHARDLIILSKQVTEIQGLPAIVSTVRYENSLNGQIWFSKDILIHSKDDSANYDIGLYCSFDDAPVLTILFDRIAQTFR